MAHEINIQDGKASMMYVGEEPWHRLGTKLDKPATAAQAIKAANLDWKVCKRPIYALEDHIIHPIRNSYAIVREDMWGERDCPVFGIVGKSYTPLQNSEAFAFFDPIVGKNAAIYHTAGALGDGERIWILAKLPSDIRIVGDDIANKYLLLSNSHDGNSSVQIKFTPIRVVCQNTLTMALRQGPALRLAHTKDLHYRLQQSEKTLGIINKRFNEIEESFKTMTRVQMPTERLKEYLNYVFPDPRDPENDRAFARVEENRLLAEYLFANGKGNQAKDVVGTLWAAYNGVTELIDHRQINKNNERRLNTVWFGEGYITKARAFNVATDRMRAWLN